MRNMHYSFLGLLLMIFITSASVKPNESKQLFEKIVFLEVSFTEDSVLFQPLSKAWNEHWKRSADITNNGTDLMNYDKYVFSFKNRTENLWTILHPKIIDGSIQSYYPFDPETYGLEPSEDGELRYPICNKEENETFLTSEKVRENVCYLLGQFGPQSDYPLINQWGEDSLLVHPDGSQSYLYPDPDYFWYEDKDIIKYRLRVSVLVNKNGKEKKRVIESISPVVDIMVDNSLIGEKELLWLNFDDLKPFLKEAYYFDEDWKPITYLDYFEQKLSNADFRAKK